MTFISGINTVVENCIVEGRGTIRANRPISDAGNIQDCCEKNERYTI